MRTRRRLVMALSMALLVGVLAMRWRPRRKSTRTMGFIDDPRRRDRGLHANVGDVSVTVPAGALPKGGPVMIHLTADLTDSSVLISCLIASSPVPS